MYTLVKSIEEPLLIINYYARDKKVTKNVKQAT